MSVMVLWCCSSSNQSYHTLLAGFVNESMVDHAKSHLFHRWAPILEQGYPICRRQWGKTGYSVKVIEFHPLHLRSGVSNIQLLRMWCVVSLVRCA
jgi:hypothetical protein